MCMAHLMSYTEEELSALAQDKKEAEIKLEEAPLKSMKKYASVAMLTSALTRIAPILEVQSKIQQATRDKLPSLVISGLKF